MKQIKHLGTFLLTLIMALTLCIPAFAAVEDTGFSDVPAGVWYSDAAQYVRDNGIMNGTSATTFNPNSTMTRAMLATVLYRAAGSPTVNQTADFRDVSAGAYYANAVAWASANKIVTGYGNDLFGAGDPVTREQIAAILWRYQGSPTPAGNAARFADQSSISSYAVNAVAWARENHIINGMEGDRFAPKNNATRAQVAVILMNFLSNKPSEPTPDTNTKALVAYFSVTGSTKNIAQHLKTALNADLYEIVPQQPYTAADINYNAANCRAEQEINNPAVRPAINGSITNMDDYDVVFIGYPIWWGQAPKIIYTFLESYDFSGKTIIPFCTSASSGIGGSIGGIQALAPNANWLNGQRFSGSASLSTVESWVNGLNIPTTKADTDKSQSSSAAKIQLAFGENKTIVTLEDNATTRDFLSMLPVTLTFQDYAGSEKISYLSRNLSIEGAPSTYDPDVGDMILYAPWGNLAIFYQDAGSSSGPIPMGHVESGLEKLSAMSGNFQVTITQII